MITCAFGGSDRVDPLCSAVPLFAVDQIICLNQIYTIKSYSRQRADPQPTMFVRILQGGWRKRMPKSKDLLSRLCGHSGAASPLLCCASENQKQSKQPATYFCLSFFFSFFVLCFLFLFSSSSSSWLWSSFCLELLSRVDLCPLLHLRFRLRLHLLDKGPVSPTSRELAGKAGGQAYAFYA